MTDFEVYFEVRKNKVGSIERIMNRLSDNERERQRNLSSDDEAPSLDVFRPLTDNSDTADLTEASTSHPQNYGGFSLLAADVTTRDTVSISSADMLGSSTPNKE